STHCAARGEALPEQRQNNYRQVSRRRDREGQRDQERDVCIRTKQNGDPHRDGADDEGRYPRDPHFFSRLALSATVNDVRVKVVRERGRSANRQTCYDGENGGESNCRNEGEEE